MIDIDQKLMEPRKAETKKGDDEHLEISAVQPVKITGGDRSAVSQFCWILTTPRKVRPRFVWRGERTDEG